MGKEFDDSLLRGGRRETKYSHGYSPSQLQALASISEALIPPIPFTSHQHILTHESDIEAMHYFYQASASQPPLPDEVAEIVEKRGLWEARLAVRTLLKILSTRIGTLLICGSVSLGKEWPYLKKFSEISLAKREKVVQKWLKHWLLIPLRLIFVFIKFLVMFVFFTQFQSAQSSPYSIFSHRRLFIFPPDTIFRAIEQVAVPASIVGVEPVVSDWCLGF